MGGCLPVLSQYVRRKVAVCFRLNLGHYRHVAGCCHSDICATQATEQRGVTLDWTILIPLVPAILGFILGVRGWRREAQTQVDVAIAESLRARAEFDTSAWTSARGRMDNQDSRIDELETENKELREQLRDKDGRIAQLEAQVEHLLQEMRRMKGMIP